MINVFVIVEEMDCPNGGSGHTLGVYSTEEKAKAVISKLEADKAANPRLYKYRTEWFIQQHELDEQ